jgi:phosphoribosylglycinamide formyltransferase 1
VKNPRWALFISGQGSNLSALLDQKWDLDVGLVISSHENAPGLLRARRSGLKTLVLDKKINWEKLHQTLLEDQIDHLFLLGFMKIVPPEFLKKWQGPILNIHPSLLPAYQGLKSIERAYADSADIGATVHHVTADVDSGAIVLQMTAVKGNGAREMTLEEVTERVHRAEYALVRRAVGRRYA